MLILDGKLVAAQTRQKIKSETEALKKKTGKVPGLAVVLVGDDPASQVYVRNKMKACEEVGFASWVHRLPATATAKEVHTQIEKLNNDSEVSAMLVQLPLPKHLNSEEVISWVDPKKDADGLTVENIGLFFAGRPRVVSCTPFGVMKILEHYKIPVAGREAVVVGRSAIVGLPMVHLLQQAQATVTMCHSKTVDLPAHTRKADIVVVAAGKPGLLGRDDFKKSAVVIDVGIHRQMVADGKSKLCGDVRPEGFEGWVSAYTPVPGGVGPMTIATLLLNTLRLHSAR